MGFANGFDFGHAFQNMFRGWIIIVEGPLLWSCRQDAGVVRPAQKNADAAFFAERQERVQGLLLLQQCIAARQQEQVKITLLGQRLADLPFIDASPKRLDDLFIAQFLQGLVAAFYHRLDVGVTGGFRAMGEDIAIMHQQNVDAVQSQTFE